MGPGKDPGIIRGGHSKNGNRSLPDRPKFPGIRAFINPFRGTASPLFFARLRQAPSEAIE